MTTHNPDDHFEIDRLEKVDELRETSDPYANTVDNSGTVGDFIDDHSDSHEFPDPEEYTLVGRITRMNDFGSVMFIDIEDESGRVQLFLHEEETDSFDDRSLLDVGDYVEARGVPTRTDTGELSLQTTDWRIVTKSLRSIPTRTGFNERNRARDRVGAMLVDETLRNSVATRFEVIEEVRTYLTGTGFREVDTPTLHHMAGGADATPFTTHCNTLDEEMALRIAPELYLKRLVMSGFEQVFEIATVYRNEDIDTSHSPEFTLLELYAAYEDYTGMMDLTEQLISHVIVESTGNSTIEYNGEMLDFSPPWDRISFEQALEDYGGIPVTSLTDSELWTLAEDEYDLSVEPEDSRGDVYIELYEETTEHQISGPCFVIDHPRESTPLCATHPDRTDTVERFEVVVAGMELANAYSELTDPVEQQDALIDQLEHTTNQEAHELDTDFIETLGYGLPPTGGLGIGLDRLAMLVANVESIKEVLPFPLVSSPSSEAP